jgi:surfactin synthase thioesterase subunit
MEGKTGNLRLFCLPYAGGSAAIYLKWKKYLDHSIELYPVELAGRGKRYQHPLYDSIQEAVDDVYEQIRKFIDQKPYAVFGHSMGSVIAYELYHKINRLHHHTPVHMFFSGRKAPHTPHDDKIHYTLPDAEFKTEILGLGGTPPEVFEHKELLDIFLPILRADYKVVETYQYVAPKSLIDCPISVLHGMKDGDINGVNEWDRHTQKDCKFYFFDGGHFFIHDETEKVAAILNDTLT